MRKLAIFFVAFAACKSAPEPIPEPAEPIANPKPSASLALTRRAEVVEEMFGQKVADPYRWLEDAANPEVKEWMAAKDAVARAHLAKLPERDAIAARLKELLYVETRTAPIKRGKKLFFTRRAKDQEKAVLYWQEGEGGEAKVLVDPNALAADGTMSLGAWAPSWDGSKLAYVIQANNADEGTMHVKEVATDRALEKDTIEHLRYTGAAWTPEGSGFYYTWIPSDPNIPSTERMGLAEIRFHALGTDPKTDRVVREKIGDSTKWMSAGLSRDGKYLFLFIYHGWAKNELWVQFVKEKNPKWISISKDVPAQFKIDVWKDRFYIGTNDGAPRWRIFAADPKKLDRAQWKEIVPEDPTGVIQDFAVIGGHLGLTYLRNASSEMQIRKLDGALVRNVSLPSLGTTSSLVGLEDEDTAYFSFSSFLYPEEIYRTSVKTGKTEVFAKVDVAVDPSRFVLEQVWFPSKDGTKVSMFIVRGKEIVKKGDNPTYLYGYGGFGVSLTPKFGAGIYPWLERGGVFAMPNLRGGGEYGEEWHQSGMLAKKQNVFDDFIAAAEWLVKEGYARPERLAAGGRSNGGLLVGAAMTQRPDLFRAVVCGVPLLDMIRYPRVGIGKAWVPEYGDPEKAEHFGVLYAYSPYHRLTKDALYPSLLLLSADADDRVDPMHARKFLAALEESQAAGRARLLRIESNSGHGGGDMRKKTVEQVADEFAFLLSEIGARPAAASISGTIAP